jgi:hypothetical protein
VTDIRITTKGEDSFAPFEVFVPGNCYTCGEDVNIAAFYKASDVRKSLTALGIKPSKSLVLKGPYAIGVTCGCYAKWHRQLAHISDRRRDNKTG